MLTLSLLKHFYGELDRSFSSEKVNDGFYLFEAHKRGCMSATLDFMHSCSWVSSNHLQHEVGRQHVGFHTAKHKDRHLDAGPILPQIETVMPGISERPHDLRVEKHDVPLWLACQATLCRVMWHQCSSLRVPKGDKPLGNRLRPPRIVEVRRDGSDIRVDGARPAQGKYGPMSLITRRRIGLPGKPARTIPTNPPSDVPTQSTLWPKSRDECVHVGTVLRKRVFIRIK